VARWALFGGIPLDTVEGFRGCTTRCPSRVAVAACVAREREALLGVGCRVSSEFRCRFKFRFSLRLWLRFGFRFRTRGRGLTVQALSLPKEPILRSDPRPHTRCSPGLSGVSKLLYTPEMLLDERNQAVLWSYLSLLERRRPSNADAQKSDAQAESQIDGVHLASSFPGINVARIARARECLHAHELEKRAAESIELHMGLSSNSESDSLSVFCRLALPHDAGGYESAWQPLYAYSLSSAPAQQAAAAATTDPAHGVKPQHEVGAVTLKVLPERARGRESRVGLVLMALRKEEGGDVGLCQRLVLRKSQDDNGVSLQGQVRVRRRGGEGEADELVRCAWSWLVDVHVHCEHVRALVVSEMHMCGVCPLVYGLGFRFRYVCVASVLTPHMCGCVYVMSVLWLSSEQEELTAKSAHVRTAPRCL
jgi:hypothetical protein